MHDNSSESSLSRVLTVLQLVFVAILILLPLAWMVLSSFKSSAAVTAYPPVLLFHPTFENYVNLARTTDFLAYARNSLIESGGATLLGLLLGVPAAFAASVTRAKLAGYRDALGADGTGHAVPRPLVSGISRSRADRLLCRADPHAGAITLPIVIWVLLPAFDAIPRSLLEAAEVDGCGVIRSSLAYRPAAGQFGHRDCDHSVLRVFMEFLSLCAGALRP